MFPPNTCYIDICRPICLTGAATQRCSSCQTEGLSQCSRRLFSSDHKASHLKVVTYIAVHVLTLLHYYNNCLLLHYCTVATDSLSDLHPMNCNITCCLNRNTTCELPLQYVLFGQFEPKASPKKPKHKQK